MATLEEMQQRISGSPVVEHGVSVVSRYTDAYLMARTIASFGAVVKGIAVVVGIVVALIGLVAGGSKGFLGGVMVGAIFGLAVYVMGIFVAAQGQILK